MGLRLRDLPLNWEGIGATVTHTSGGSCQIRSVQTGRSYLAANTEAHFGIGGEQSATAEIRWPDGVVQKVTDLKLMRCSGAISTAGRQ